ncbi:MAG: DegT/DnrJ/EryC1/StrS family aminotransferase [Candidatus Omnitrophica bacterium]|nr:DegT/DnrJ/EryC1/StrS family aminotransferase [Candidatus Omnitrophota bacterium]
MKIDTAKSATLSAKAKYKVPFGTVSVTPEARQLINQALDSNWLTRGKFVQEFEEEFAALFGVKHAVAVSSGTDADALACAVLYDHGAKRGDEIIIPALTFVATGNAVLQAGFTPVFVDIQRETLNIDPERIEKAVTPRTRAIMPVHLMGKPAEMDAILRIARKHKLHVIEDAAEAHGAEYKGRKVGAIGDMAAFSLYAAHIVTTIEGGIVITNDAATAEALRSLRNHGIVGKFEFRRVGFSAKMNELEAAVGLGNIKIFRQILDKRRRNLLYLIDKFKRFEKHFITIQEEPHEKIGPHAFSIIVREKEPFTKDEFVAYLDQSGVDSRNLFYSIPTQCPSYAFLGKKPGDFPEAEYCSGSGTHIGIHQDLELKQLDYVVEVTEEFLKSKAIKF